MLENIPRVKSAWKLTHILKKHGVDFGIRAVSVVNNSLEFRFS